MTNGTERKTLSFSYFLHKIRKVLPMVMYIAKGQFVDYIDGLTQDGSISTANWV